MTYNRCYHPDYPERVILELRGAVDYERCAFNDDGSIMDASKRKLSAKAQDLYLAAYADYTGFQLDLYADTKSTAKVAAPTAPKSDIANLVRRYRTAERAWEAEDEEAWLKMRNAGY